MENDCGYSSRIKKANTRICTAMDCYQVWETLPDGQAHPVMTAIPPGPEDMTDDLELTVPPGQYFLLNDNRSFMADSRSAGTVPREAVLGKVMYVLLGSLDRIGADLSH